MSIIHQVEHQPAPQFAQRNTSVDAAQFHQAFDTLQIPKFQTLQPRKPAASSKRTCPPPLQVKFTIHLSQTLSTVLTTTRPRTRLKLHQTPSHDTFVPSTVYGSSIDSFTLLAQQV